MRSVGRVTQLYHLGDLPASKHTHKHSFSINTLSYYIIHTTLILLREKAHILDYTCPGPNTCNVSLFLSISVSAEVSTCVSHIYPPWRTLSESAGVHHTDRWKSRHVILPQYLNTCASWRRVSGRRLFSDSTLWECSAHRVSFVYHISSIRSRPISPNTWFLVSLIQRIQKAPIILIAQHNWHLLTRRLHAFIKQKMC